MENVLYGMNVEEIKIMSKVILVIDDPTCCLMCSCSSVIYQNMKCLALGEKLTEDEVYDEKPEWCPLKSVQYIKEKIIKELKDRKFENCKTDKQYAFNEGLIVAAKIVELFKITD